jgi:SnoaL-like polyketide cyclase
MIGTNTGEGAGLPPTNKPFRIRGVSVGILDSSGKIKHNRDYWNLAAYLMQVGILPPR